jgi:uncharacterized membrane protein
MPHPLARVLGCLVVLPILLFLVVEQRTAGAEGRRPQRPDALIATSEAADALAQKYAPIVHIRDQREACDTRGSPYLPAPVEFLFGQPDIVLRQHVNGRTIDVDSDVDATDLYGLDDTYFLDFPGNPKRPGCRYEQDYLSRSGAYTPTAYAHIAYQEDREGFALQYWFFYYFNHWNNTHEGDWEMIQLTFEGPTPAEALSQQPLGVGYSQHGSGERSSWDDSKLTREDGRPVSFVAAGANANLFEPNIILGRGDNGTGFGCDDATRPSRRVEPRVVLVNEPEDATSEFAWLAFDGRWGERAPWEFNGPTGPNDKRAWTQPFSWQEDLRPSSIIVPSRNAVGPNAVNVFCDVVWYLSTPFAQLLRLPPVVILAGFVATAGGFAFLATRTAYRPILVEPLRRRRRVGQILTGAWRIYRLNWRLFIGVAALFVPVGLLIAGLQWLVFRLPYEDTISGFFGQQLIVKVVIALAFGNLAASITYWAVLAGCLAAVSRIDRREPNSVFADYRDILRKLAALVVPRLKSLAVVILLALTVIGAPFALWFAFRWAFIEEAVLLDGATRSDAMSRSRRTVDGHWWRAALILSALGIFAFLIGPAIAAVLLLFSSFGVNLVNVVSSAVFALVTPFIAIAQALLYFDLRARSQEADP